MPESSPLDEVEFAELLGLLRRYSETDMDQPEPGRRGVVRYWDGERWTDERATPFEPGPQARRDWRRPPSQDRAGDLILLCAPPGFRTLNLRIKSPLLCR